MSLAPLGAAMRGAGAGKVPNMSGPQGAGNFPLDDALDDLMQLMRTKATTESMDTTIMVSASSASARAREEALQGCTIHGKPAGILYYTYLK